MEHRERDANNNVEGQRATQEHGIPSKKENPRSTDVLVTSAIFDGSDQESNHRYLIHVAILSAGRKDKPISITGEFAPYHHRVRYHRSRTILGENDTSRGSCSKITSESRVRRRSRSDPKAWP